MATGKIRTLSLRKGNARHVFRYRVGDEQRVLPELVALVEDPDVSFDWHDAFVMSFHLGRRREEDLETEDMTK